MREIKEDGFGVKSYIPHHDVYRREKSATKLRTVFTASSPSTSGKSLNSIPFKGGLIQEDFFSIMVRFESTMTRSTIREDVGVAIVPQTISRHLAEANLKSKRPFRALPLTRKHRQLRLQWCQARSMWNVTDWQKVVISDESRFLLGTNDNRARVWRRPGERYNSPHTVLSHTARIAGVMVWGIIAYDSRTFLNGLPGAIFQQDNARPHTARVPQDFLRHFQTIPRPARSPDLSSIEHVWDQLKWQMPSCHSVHDLKLSVQDLWFHLPQDNIKCLINSMPDRVAACIAAGGGSTCF
ncbi:transposable element Tc1 transposase [Trichonephila clavipes]|nr:transposable element Tc1 transposase [Trichonephila clavipes]